MANEKGTSDEKKARLEAIRAANAAKKSQEAGNGDTMPVAAVTATPAAPPTVAATTAPAAVGANMSDDKKAKLEAIRAANAAKKGVEPSTVAAAPALVAATTAPAATRPAAAPAASAPAPRPAARAATKPVIMADDRVPLTVSCAVRRSVPSLGPYCVCCWPP